MNDNLENLNQKWWDAVTPHHLSSNYYAVDAFLKGADTLMPLELEALGDLRGKRLLHLQCHIGLDSLSWARRGARVTGVDFSGPSVEAARKLAQRAGLEGSADFVQADVLEWHKQAKPQFDAVVSTYGVLCWLRDLKAWAKGVEASLKPGGMFFLADGHPLADLLSWSSPEGNVAPSYFGRAEGYGEGETAPDYASDHVVAEGNRQWIRPISASLQSLTDSGLVLRQFREYPFSFYEHMQGLEKGADGYWRLPKGQPERPFLFSLLMQKPLA